MSATVATAVLQFIGLVTFSHQWSSDGHLQAETPRVSHLHEAADSQVETHVTIIVFPESSRVASSAWELTKLPSSQDYRYVVLDGVRVTFAGSAEAARMKSTTSDEPTSMEALQLPGLKSCFGMTKLKDEFTPTAAGVPSGVAALFDLPAGTAHAGLGRFEGDGGDARSRVDTLVNIDVSGDLVITATDAEHKNKTLRLRTDAPVLIANLEKSFLSEETKPSLYTPHHWLVYLAMGTDGSVPNGFACAHKDVPPCEASPFREMHPHQGPAIAARVDYECSNSQWP